MSRLDEERQNKLEPKRVDYAVYKILDLGYDITFQDDKEIRFNFLDEEIKFFPYSGWHTGKSIKDGRGLKELLKKIETC